MLERLKAKELILYNCKQCKREISTYEISYDRVCLACKIQNDAFGRPEIPEPLSDLRKKYKRIERGYDTLDDLALYDNSLVSGEWMRKAEAFIKWKSEQFDKMVRVLSLCNRVLKESNSQEEKELAEKVIGLLKDR